MALRPQNIFGKGTSGLISGSLWSKVEPGAKKRNRHGILELQEQAVEDPYYNLKNYGGRSFAVAAPRLWNALPMVVKSWNSVNTFKRQLKSHLFLCSYVNC